MNNNFFWIPAHDSHDAETELNGFLTSHRILQVEKAFSTSETAPGWSLCVQWLSKNAEDSGTVAKGRTGKVDYRELLDEDSFRIFAVLRTWRKDRAAEQSVPVYTVATNEQLARIARDRIQTKSGLEDVEGFGASRIGKYGADLVTLCQQTMSVESENAP